MSFHKDILIVAALAVFGLLAIHLLPLLDIGTDSVPVSYAGNGPCDLTSFDFSSSYAEVSASNIEFYPNTYLNPSELPRVADAPGFTYAQFATERIRFIVPDDDIYTLTFMLPSYAGKVFINGGLVKEIGEIGTKRSEIEIDYKWCVLHATPHEGEIELVIQSANFVRSGQYIELPKINIGKAAFFQPEDYFTNFNSMIVMGGLLIAALLLLGLWAFNVRMTQNLWFSLECFIMAIRAGLTGDTLQRAFPFVSRMAALKTEYASIALLLIFLILHYNKIFPGIYQRWARNINLSLAITYSALCFILPTEITSSFFVFSYLLLGSSTLYLAVRLCMRLRKTTLDQMIALAGAALFVIGASEDIFLFAAGSFGPGKGTMIEASALVFALFQMTALFVGNNRMAAEARESELKTAEEKRMLEEMNRLKTEFLGNVSHELKTPLTVMSGYAQKSGRSLSAIAGANEVADSVRLIGSEADRLALMVSQILDVTRIEEGRMDMNLRPSSFMEIAQDTVSIYYPVFSKNNNTLDLSGIPDLPEVRCDPQRIMQVLVNLIANAAKHTRDGKISLSAEEGDDFVTVTVSDTGDGIAPERLPHIFDRYKSYDKNEARPGNDSGTGLGLYICKYIIEEHGGEICVASEQGIGTDVSFSLPVHMQF